MANENFEQHLSVSYSEEWIGIRQLKLKYTAEIIHSELHEHKIFSSYDRAVLSNKVNEYLNKLKTKYSSLEQKKLTGETIKSAEERTNEAKAKLIEIDRLLIHTLSINDEVDWSELMDYSEFEMLDVKLELKKAINKLPQPPSPSLKTIPEQPLRESFNPKYNLFDHILKSLKQKKIMKAEEDYVYALAIWEADKIKIEDFNQKEIDRIEELVKFHRNKIIEITNEYKRLEDEWLLKKEEFYKNREISNSAVNELKSKYEQGDESAVEEYCEIVLNNSSYPDDFPKTFRLVYNNTNKSLVIDYDLPPIDKLPKLKEVKFISKEMKEYFLSEAQQSANFDLVMYRICLRTLHEVFEADVANNIEMICFNGWVNAMDKAKGYRINSCIMSIQVTKDEFININLAEIDEKACFKSLKGIGSSKLSGISAVQPIIQINRDDKRIVEHYNVSDGLDSSTNLASMDWEDFENLIREVFEREFQSTGGEVRVTQASRDGGVDAIAFDSDPIRGGKIVIQAKRYTNTVGVSAVRDLFGTLNHEGATKGILVTTADYGPDAYEFAKGKPISLLNGANLLYLLQKHGYSAKIDIAEAKKEINR